MLRTVFLFLALLAVTPRAVAQAVGVMESPRQRVVVLTDIDNEPDDQQSLVRLLLYSDCIDIRGLVATTSTHLQGRVAPEVIRSVVRAYGEVVGNLRLHSSDYPPADSLMAKVSEGTPRYGLSAVGEGKDSPGARLIVSELDSTDPRPLWICCWGGTNTLAQALYNIRCSRGAKETLRLVAKLRVYAIADQDDTGLWLRREFPTLFYVTSGPVYDGAQWTRMSSPCAMIDDSLISPEWIAANIQQGHGPLGRMYPDVAYTMEGDTPSFLGLIPNGLNNMEHPDWGGWGGRFRLAVPDYHAEVSGSFGVPHEPEPRPLWTEAADTLAIVRWRDDFQRDFAARMLWCSRSYAEANHAPQPTVRLWTATAPHSGEGEARREIADFTVHSGQYFHLDASATSDPDGDAVSFQWRHLPEATGFPVRLYSLDRGNIHNALYQAPTVSRTTWLHFLLRVTDKGTPRMTAYKRIIIKVKP